MKINEKIKLIRNLKGWSQEEIAEKLAMSIGAYANIERGETNIQLSRLEQISKILDVKLPDLVDSDEKNFQIFLVGNCVAMDNKITICPPNTQQQYELEKSQLKIKYQQKEILYLQEEVAYLKNIIASMTKNDKDII